MVIVTELLCTHGDAARRAHSSALSRGDDDVDRSSLRARQLSGSPDR
jgi:hypothetical protein